MLFDSNYMANYKIPLNAPEHITVDGWDEAWKFSSGLMILRYWSEYTSNFTSWNNGTYTSAVPGTPRSIPSGVFLYNPTFIIGDSSYGHANAGHWFESDGWGSTIQSPAYFAVRPSSDDGLISYCITAIGRWK